MKQFVFILSLLTTSLAFAAEKLPTFPRNTDYGDARKSLKALGWQPVTLEDSDTCSPNDPRCTGRPEMHICSGSGLAQCLFTWKKGSTLIEVITLGEDRATIQRVRCRAGC